MKENNLNKILKRKREKKEKERKREREKKRKKERKERNKQYQSLDVVFDMFEVVVALQLPSVAKIKKKKIIIK